MNRFLMLCGVIVALGVVLLASGCRRRGHSTTIVNNNVSTVGAPASPPPPPPPPDDFDTDPFPGAPMQDGNVADDGNAFSPSGESCFRVTMFFNGDTGNGIAMYATGGSGGVAPYHLYVHYYNGTSWTPPVTLEAPDVDWTATSGFGQVAFLNTVSHPSPAAQARNGDAIITWRAHDLDGDGALTADGANECLFATYFDATHAGEPAMRFGFQETAVRLSVADSLDEDVATAGIVSDGLIGEHGFATNGQFGYRFGDDTTSLVVFWRQLEDNDGTTPGTEDSALHFAWFDPASGPDPEVPLVPSPDTRIAVLGFGASDSGGDSEETQVDEVFRVYNNVLFFRVASDDEPTAGFLGIDDPPTSIGYLYGTKVDADDDITLQYVAFDLSAGTYAGPFNASSYPTDSTDTGESTAQFLNTNDSGILKDTPSIYGSDEGLAQLVILFCQLPYDADAGTDFGSLFLDGLLLMSGIDEATGAWQSGSIFSLDDPTILDSIPTGKVSTRISRNGDYIWVAWLQPTAMGSTDDDALFAAEFSTTRPAADGTFTLPVVSTACSVPVMLNPEIDGYGVTSFQFQDGLGYVCGSQSDPDVMSLLYCQDTSTLLLLFQARLTADLFVFPVPDIDVTLLDTFEGASDILSLPVINDAHQNLNAVDGGAGGELLVVFRQDVGGAAEDDCRLFALRTGAGGGKVEIDSDKPTRQVPHQEFRLVVTPPGTTIGTFDKVTMVDSPDRAHPASLVHVLFLEDRYAEGSGTGPALRSRVFDASLTGVGLGDAFTPSAGTAFAPPFSLELPFLDPDPLDSPVALGVAVDDTTVGLWFAEEGHLYYQEFTESALDWLTLDGVSDPILIDNDSPALTIGAVGPFIHPGTCGSLHGATIFWIKDLAGSGLDFRLQVRVRE